MIRQLDHIVILVNDLQRTITDYTKLGFTTAAGGEHPGGVTHNALVAFSDGAYLELIAFKRPDEEHRWWRIGQRSGEGLVDFALLPGDIEQDIADARERGLELEGPIEGGRLRPDGVKLEWQTARPPSGDLPFLCGDRTPRNLRVPEGAAHRHANGTTGVARLTIGVEDLEASIGHYHALLDSSAPGGKLNFQQSDVDGIRSATFLLGTTQITLASPNGSDSTPSEEATALRTQLETRGPGPFAITFLAPETTTPGTVDLTLSHGARLQLASSAANTGT